MTQSTNHAKVEFVMNQSFVNRDAERGGLRKQTAPSTHAADDRTAVLTKPVLGGQQGDRFRSTASKIGRNK